MLMKRTQLYIDVETYQLAASYASRIGTTISDLTRIALRAHIPRVVKLKTHTAFANFAKKYPAPVGTPVNISSNPDEYLYTS